MTPLYPQKLALTSPTGGGRSVGIVRSRTKATEFSLVFFYIYTVTKDKDTLVVAGREIGLEVNVEKMSIWSCLEIRMLYKMTHKD